MPGYELAVVKRLKDWPVIVEKMMEMAFNCGKGIDDSKNVL